MGNINGQHSWMALMDSIHQLTVLMDGINGRQYWTALMDGINGRHQWTALMVGINGRH